jgi:hypothetical protein
MFSPVLFFYLTLCVIIADGFVSTRTKEGR